MINLYTETSVDIKPTTASSRIAIQIPRINGSLSTSKHTSEDSNSKDGPNDETKFASRYLGTSSSFYFRETKQYPRTFRWRILNDQRVLEIQPADLSRSEKDQREAYLTLVFRFQDAILPLAISFADTVKSDELHIFVCTDRNEIFNLRLPAEFFRNSNSIGKITEEWCRPVETSALTIDRVYHIHASSPYEIFVAFTGGRIQALRRKADSDNWTPEYYDDSSWGSTLRGLVSRRGQHQIEHGSKWFAATAVQGMIASPDTNYLYTICLNHTLRVWHLPSGRLVDTRDLLDKARDQNDGAQLSPAEPAFLRLIRHPKSKYPVLVTFTPHEGGQFKFWNIKGGLTDPLVIEDRYPKQTLSPPDPDPTGNTVWSMTGFHIIPGNELKPCQAWVLWRNNNHHQLYSLHFEFPSLVESWSTNWVQTATNIGRSRCPDLVLNDPQDVASKWLEYLFFPNRFSTAVLESALHRYASLTSTKIARGRDNRLLRDRMTQTIASTVALRKYQDSELDYERFIIDTDQQWRNYWRIVESLNEGRYAPLSLCFDAFTDMVWIALADQSVAIRECSYSELLQLNSIAELKQVEMITSERWPHRRALPDLAACVAMTGVMKAAASFRKSFSPELTSDLRAAIEEELFTQSEIPTPDRIVLIFNQVGFSDGLSAGSEEQLLSDLQPTGGVSAISTEMFTAILDVLSPVTKRPKSSLRTTVFGSSLLSAMLLDDIVSTKRLLLDLLILTIFIDESDSFHPTTSFEHILSALKGQERNLWLATHFRSIPLSFPGSSTSSSKVTTVPPNAEDTRSVSVLEDVFGQGIRPQPAVDRPMMYLLTDLIAESQRWISGKDAVTPEDATVHIQCYLIAHNDIGLASEFLHFQPSTPWSTYVKARLRLARSEFEEAAICFREAAYTLACGKAIGDLKEYSAGLLSIVDASHFNSGIPRYFQHVMELFEGKKAYVQVAQFGRLSIKALSSNQKDVSSTVKQEVLLRLFTAELQSARFQAAYEALVSIEDGAVQRSSAKMLVNTMLNPTSSMLSESDSVKTLQQLPWSLHPQLAETVDSHILALAKKQSSVPLSGQWISSGSVDYLSVLHALRLSKSDYRGATAILFERLQIIQKSGRARSEPQVISIRNALLALINELSCVPADEAYILANVDDDPRLQGTKRSRNGEDSAQIDNSHPQRKRRRMIITLDDLRREYQQVLDKCSRIERGDFDFDLNADDDDEFEDDEQIEYKNPNGVGRNGHRHDSHEDAMEM